MRSARLRALPGLTGCLLLTAAAGAQSVPDLPEGKGKAEFARVCGHCHGVAIVIKKGNTAAGWADVVDDMVSRGAQGTQDDFDLVVEYLAAHFGPKVNVNRADADELSTALGLSPAEARAIVHYRETAGSFKDWRDLERVPQIDIKKLEKEKDRIDFSTGSEDKNDPSGDKK